MKNLESSPGAKVIQLPSQSPEVSIEYVEPPKCLSDVKKFYEEGKLSQDNATDNLQPHDTYTNHGADDTIYTCGVTACQASVRIIDMHDDSGLKFIELPLGPKLKDCIN